MPKSPATGPGDARDPVRAVIDNARELPDGSHGGDGKREPRGKNPHLPDGCPVIPWGHRDGILFCNDASGQFREVKRPDRLICVDLYGIHQSLLVEHFPRLRGDKPTGGFAAELMQSALIAACHWEGIFDPAASLRGRGAHRGDDGELIYHAGDAVWRGRAPLAPGRLGDFLYPGAPPIPAPWPRSVQPNELKPLRDKIASFNWRRPIDAHLFLGQLGALPIGGALPWRPNMWVTGPRGSGKSSLQALVSGLFGKGVIATADPTAAALRQLLKYQTIPILLDEFEPAEDNRRNQEVIKLIRNSASGALAVRGGAEHEAQEFTLRSAVLCASVLVPPLLPQDASRLVILRLAKPSQLVPPDLTPGVLAPLGRKILRRLFDQWPSFDQRFQQFRRAFLEHGHDARGADLYAAVCACADMLLSNHPVDSDSAAEMASALAPSVTIEAGEEQGEEQRWLAHLLSKSLPLDGAGTKNLLVEWLRRSVGDHFHAEAEEADRILAAVGIKIIRPKAKTKPTHFAIANYHAGTARLFDREGLGFQFGGLQRVVLGELQCRNGARTRFTCHPETPAK